MVRVVVYETLDDLPRSKHAKLIGTASTLAQLSVYHCADQVHHVEPRRGGSLYHAIMKKRSKFRQDKKRYTCLVERLISEHRRQDSDGLHISFNEMAQIIRMKGDQSYWTQMTADEFIEKIDAMCRTSIETDSP